VGERRLPGPGGLAAARVWVCEKVAKAMYESAGDGSLVKVSLKGEARKPWESLCLYAQFMDEELLIMRGIIDRNRAVS